MHNPSPNGNGDHRRDPRGRFTLGNAGGPGRPKKEPPPIEFDPRLVVTPMELLLLADTLEMRAKVLIELEKRCDPAIIARMHHLIAHYDRLAGVDQLFDHDAADDA